MKKLDLILSVQDHLYLAAPALKNYLGKARASQITPLKSYLDAGFLVALAAAGELQPAELIVVVGHGRRQVSAHLARLAPDTRMVVQDRLDRGERVIGRDL